MINKLPFLGWLLSFAASVSLSVPFWLCWTVCQIGKTYFDFIPTKYQSIPFWDCVGIFIVISILKGTFALSLVNITQNVKLKKEDA